MNHFDLVVVGCGSGGSATADRAQQYGKKVCIIDRGVVYKDGVRYGAGFGGTCVNVGCVPKKIMFMAANMRETVHGSLATAAGFGVQVKGVGSHDWATLKRNRDAYVNRLTTGVQEWPEVTLKTGLARLIGPKTVEISPLPGSQGKTETVTADHVLIGVGGYPIPCTLPGRELTITSDGFFDLETQPKRCAVVGAGYVAVEMAGILNAMGTNTTLFCRGETVLRAGYDPYIISILMDTMKKHGPNVRPFSQPKSLSRAPDGTITLTMEDGSEHKGFDTVLWAVGRTPATKSLNLESAGVKCNSNGQIIVDEYENTNVEGVYALGDVTQTGWELTPVAIAAGRRLADRLFGGLPGGKIFYSTIPTIVFSHPPIGMIGLTQPDAEKKFGKENIRVKESTFSSMLYAFNDDDHKVMTGLKLVLCGPTDRIVGLHIIGPSSDEILQGFAVAVRMGATLSDFEQTVALHPTIGEELITFGGWGKNKEGKPVRHAPPKPVALGAAAAVTVSSSISGTASSGTTGGNAEKKERSMFQFIFGVCVGCLVSYGLSSLRSRRSSL